MFTRQQGVLTLVLALFTAGTGIDTGRLARAQSGPSAGPATPPSAAELGQRLRAHAVTADDFARSVFYTWTSPEQVAALRSSKTLLVATAQVGGRPSPFLRFLTERVKQRQPGHELAAVLSQHPQLQRRRYAWTSPFATVLGLGERSYGAALIQLVLRPQALIGRLDPQRAEPFFFVDLRGTPVALAEVLKTPERIAAIYHVRPPRPQEPTDFVPFREYILCNEAMIQSWEVDTDAIRARLASEVALLQALRPHFAGLAEKEAARSAVPAWAGVAAEAPLAAQWRAALAFDNRKYRPRPANLDQIVAGLLRYQATGSALTYAPVANAAR